MADTTHGLTDDQIAELREELQRELTRLERSMKTTGEAARPVELDQSALGRLSRIDAIQNQQLTAELHSREQARHAQLVDALSRMDDGTYGICSACQQSIPFGRLLVLPEARTCASCGPR